MRWPTITRNNDFRRAYARGKSYVGGSVVLYVCKNRARCTRIGITCSKKIGNAVQRNRARRVIRAALDAVLPAGGVGGLDLVIVARSAATRQKSTQVATTLQKLLTQACPGPMGQKKPAPKKDAAPAAPVPVAQEKNARQDQPPLLQDGHFTVQHEKTQENPVGDPTTTSPAFATTSTSADARPKAADPPSPLPHGPHTDT